MPAKLKNIRLREISFVDKGASGDAAHRPSVAFWKRKPAATPISKEHPMKLSVEILKKVNAAIQLRKDGMPEGAQAVLDGIKSKLDESEWAVVEMMLAAGVPAPIAAAAPKDAPVPPVAEPKPEEMAKSQAAAVAKALAGILNPTEPDAIAKLAKSSPELAAALEQFSKRASDAEAKVAAVEKQAKEATEKFEKSEKERAEEFQKARVERFTKIAETDLKALRGTPGEVAKRLAEIEDAIGPEEFKKYLEEQKAAANLVAKSGAFKPVGAGGSSVETDGSAYAEITKKAEELRAKDPKLTIAKARTLVTKDRANVELLKRYREETAGAH